MSMIDTVLVLSRDNSRARDLKTILEFVGGETVLDDGASRECLAGKDPSVLAEVGVAVIDGADNADLQDEIALVCKVAEGVPILLLDGPSLDELNPELQARVIARLEWPPNYTKMIDSLYRA